MTNLILPKTITQNQINDFKKYYEITKLNDRNLSTFNPQSLLNTLATIFELNLSNNPIKKELALIPYGNELQVQIQEDGFLTLLQRSNCVVDFQREIITNKHIYNEETKHWEINPAKIFEQKEIIGYYGMITIKDYLGKNITFIKGMTKKECEDHRKKYSKAGGNSPWSTSFDAMALKTVIKAIIRDINKNPSIKLKNQNLINKALQVDQSAIVNDGEIIYIDNPNNDKNTVKLDNNFRQMDNLIKSKLEENINKLDEIIFKNE